MRKALESVPGVRTAEVDFDSKQARVTYDGKVAKPEQMMEAVRKAGYVATVKAAPAAP